MQKRFAGSHVGSGEEEEIMKGMHHRLLSAVGVALRRRDLADGAGPRRSAGTGSAGLRRCHEETVKAFAPTKHGAKLDASGEICQACHGDVAAHLEDPTAVKPPRLFGKEMLAPEKTAVCLPATTVTASWPSGTPANTGRTTSPAATATASTARRPTRRSPRT